MMSYFAVDYGASIVRAGMCFGTHRKTIFFNSGGDCESNEWYVPLLLSEFSPKGGTRALPPRLFSLFCDNNVLLE